MVKGTINEERIVDETWNEILVKSSEPKRPIRNLFYWIKGGRNEDIPFDPKDRIRYELFRSSIEDESYDDWLIYLNYSGKDDLTSCEACGLRKERRTVECDFSLEGERKEILLSAHYAEIEEYVVIQEAALHRLLEKRFVGARPIHPKSVEGYVNLSAKNCLHRLPAVIVGKEFCRNCKESLYCPECHDVPEKCLNCNSRISSKSATGRLDYHDRCSYTVSLEKWNGDDFALDGVVEGVMVSGRVLEAMLELKLYSFMYGPVVTDLHDMAPALYDRVKELRRDFDCFKD